MVKRIGKQIGLEISMKKKSLLMFLSAGMVILAGCSSLADLIHGDLGPQHQHCMKIAGLCFRIYASDHDGKFPFHTNGFGNALVNIGREDPSSIPFLVGVDDNASWLKDAITNHTDVPEDICTRIYVQGLTETNNTEIAILFDKYAVRGGDHFRSRSKPYLREVCLLDGSMQTVTLDRWPAFASNQVELLVQEGISRKSAEAYYRPTLDPNAKR